MVQENKKVEQSTHRNLSKGLCCSTDDNQSATVIAYGDGKDTYNHIHTGTVERC